VSLEYRGRISEILSQNVIRLLSKSILFQKNLRAVPSEIPEITPGLNQWKGKFSDRSEFLFKSEKLK
jgi:hypothetical protein